MRFPRFVASGPLVIDFDTHETHECETEEAAADLAAMLNAVADLAQPISRAIRSASAASRSARTPA